MEVQMEEREREIWTLLQYLQFYIRAFSGDDDQP